MAYDDSKKEKRTIKILEERSKGTLTAPAPNLLPYFNCIYHKDKDGRVIQK